MISRQMCVCVCVYICFMVVVCRSFECDSLSLDDEWTTGDWLREHDVELSEYV